jgi:hypothetical protein
VKYIIFLLLPILAACATQPPPDIQRIEVVQKINVPPEILVPCVKVNLSDNPSIEEIALENIQLISLYGECRIRQVKLIDAIREVTK